MPIGADRHWTCAIACNPKRALGGDSTVDSPACVLYSDSLDGANEPAVDLFRSFMTAYAQKQNGSVFDFTTLNMPTRRLRVQRQHNYRDCALCALSQPQHPIPHLCSSYSDAAHVRLRTLPSHTFSPFWCTSTVCAGIRSRVSSASWKTPSSSLRTPCLARPTRCQRGKQAHAITGLCTFCLPRPPPSTHTPFTFSCLRLCIDPAKIDEMRTNLAALIERRCRDQMVCSRPVPSRLC